MPAIEVGRVCIKTKGREAGKKAVVISVEKAGKMVTIDGPNIRRRKCNIMHLIPTAKKVSISKNTSHEEIKKLLSD